MADGTRRRSATGGTRGDETGDSRGLLLSRILVTWVELIVVGFAGAALGGATSGPPQLVVYLASVLAFVGVLLYNVDRLVAARL
ncbi:hypothetical protein RYH80_19030 [Halobaculum sp. MBLA0147]|uniref:hypothetical protein n=1 Tax=Halobaculum sp. MBLA0147 TaxID=3079934 RepID=UPI0035243D27